MNKSELIKQIAGLNNLNVEEASTIVSILLETIKESLLDGQRVEIRGFGTFKMKDYPAYVGRNPRTGESVSVKAKRIPFFRAGKEMKEQVNA
ncbi:MAG: integration host factor subunit beta [Desulfovibrio sp.]|nr:integration host factor subunit beta [Desulfovibrio sp.]